MSTDGLAATLARKTVSRPGLRSPGDGREGLQELLFHPAGLSTTELRVWTVLKAEPGLGVCQISVRLDRHRKSVSRAISRLTDQHLVALESPGSTRRDHSSGRLLPVRYVALDPQLDIGTSS